MDKVLYNVFFSGGLDSTYRLCQLALDDNAIILIGHLKNINNFSDTQFISDILLYFSEDKSKSPMIAGLKYKN